MIEREEKLGTPEDEREEEEALDRISEGDPVTTPSGEVGVVEFIAEVAPGTEKEVASVKITEGEHINQVVEIDVDDLERAA